MALIDDRHSRIAYDEIGVGRCAARGWIWDGRGVGIVEQLNESEPKSGKTKFHDWMWNYNPKG